MSASVLQTLGLSPYSNLYPINTHQRTAAARSCLHSSNNVQAVVYGLATQTRCLYMYSRSYILHMHVYARVKFTYKLVHNVMLILHCQLSLLERIISVCNIFISNFSIWTHLNYLWFDEHYICSGVA